MRTMLLCFGFVTMISSIIVTEGTCQRIKFKKGDLGFLKAHNRVSVEYKYTDLMLSKYKSEEAYFQNRNPKDSIQLPMSVQGSMAKWHAHKEEHFEPAFFEAFQDQVSGHRIRFKEGSNAKCVMVVHTVFIQPGMVMGMAKKDASVNVKLIFFDRSEPDTILAEIFAQYIKPEKPLSYKHPGTDGRIKSAFANCGRLVGKFVKSNMP